MPNTAASTDLPLGIGLYTAADAARLLKLPARNIRRWLGGYSFAAAGREARQMEPLWQPQLPADNDIELGFRDLIELRFVAAFQAEGLATSTIRRCLLHARQIVGDERPFSTRRFHTDGRTIFVSFVEHAIADAPEGDRLPASERARLVDLKSGQHVFREVIQRTFRDLDVDADAVVRWRPYKGKESIVIDPRRAFGEPIAAQTGVPTKTLADAFAAEGNEARVAALFNVAKSVVADAVAFESQLSPA